MLATTAGATPYVLTHPDVFLDLPLTFDSLHKTVDQVIACARACTLWLYARGGGPEARGEHVRI